MKLFNGHPQEVGYQTDGTYVPNPYFMQYAIDLGAEGPAQGQHPVGAVVVRTWKDMLHATNEQTSSGDARTELRDVDVILGAAANAVEGQTMWHAEVGALYNAESRRVRHSLKGGVLYTTHEPCPMCAGTIANSKLAGVVYGTGAEDARQLIEEQGIKWRANKVSGLDIIRGKTEPGMPSQFIIGGFMRNACFDLLKNVSLINPDGRLLS